MYEKFDLSKIPPRYIAEGLVALKTDASKVILLTDGSIDKEYAELLRICLALGGITPELRRIDTLRKNILIAYLFVVTETKRILQNYRQAPPSTEYLEDSKKILTEIHRLLEIHHPEIL